MRSVWKGAVSFGLVTIPVKLYRATETRDVAFHQVRRSDGSRIRYQRVAAADGEPVEYADIAKGYELPSGETVVLTEDDLRDLPLVSSRAIDVERFVPGEQVDPIYADRAYYVEPDGPQARKPYILLRDALAGSGRVALVKVALRQREQVAVLRVREGVFVLETMLWPDEVRAADFPFLQEEIEVRPQELAMATSLIESLAGDFDPADYTDAYREAVEAVVAAKVEGHQVITPVADGTPTTGQVVDLMAALRASVDAAKKARGQTPSALAAQDEPETREKAPAKAAKRAPAAVASKVSAKAAPAAEAVEPPAKGTPAGKTVKPPAKAARAAKPAAKAGKATARSPAKASSAAARKEPARSRRSA